MALHPFMDRYRLAHAFETEKIKRSIMNCDDLEAAKTMALKLLQLCDGQKHMLAQLLLPPQ